jgi:hypothetical protein
VDHRDGLHGYRKSVPNLTQPEIDPRVFQLVVGRSTDCATPVRTSYKACPVDSVIM